MKKLLVLTSALVICGASMAHAAGAHLSWSNCNTASTSANYSFLCDDNAATRNLATSFVLAAPLVDFVAVGLQIDVTVGAASTPAWFSFGSGGCREGAFAPINVGTLGFCTNSYAGAGQAGGMVFDPAPAPNKIRLRGQWARDAAFPLSLAAAPTRYSAFVMQLNTSGSVDEGFGACEGCDVPACFVLNNLAVYGLNTGLFAEFDATTPDTRTYATYQGGGVGGAGCPGETPSKASTWGAVKALYR